MLTPGRWRCQVASAVAEGPVARSLDIAAINALAAQA